MKRRNFLQTTSLAMLATVYPAKTSFQETQVSDRLSFVDNYINSMPLSDKIKQILMYNPKNSGEIISNSNIILMGWSFPSGLYEKVKDITSSYEIKNFISVDQEGGGVRRIKNSREFRNTRFPSVTNLGKMSEEQVFEEGKKYGAMLKCAGINMLLTSLDAADPNTKMYFDRRSFGSEVETVIRKANSYFDGIRSLNQQITILGQHFPVYNISANSDYSRAVDNSTKEKLEEKSKSFFNVDIDGFMISSIIYPSISSKPASLDETLLSWARKKGDDKILMSDDFRGLVRQGNSLEFTAIKMFNTEMDILLMIPLDYVIKTNYILQEYIKNTEGAEARLNQKVKRILSRKHKTGLFNGQSI